MKIPTHDFSLASDTCSLKLAKKFKA
jgi:hypothetical protein